MSAIARRFTRFSRRPVLLGVALVVVCGFAFSPTGSLGEYKPNLTRWSSSSQEVFAVEGLPETIAELSPASWESESEMPDGSEVPECIGWDPAADPKDDPVGCLKARQYRQVQVVLKREIEGTHEKWYFTKKHNVPTLEYLLQCFSPVSDPNYRSCPKQPLVVSSYWYTATTINGELSGEGIWQASILNEMEELGVKWIAVGPYNNFVQVANMMPDVYRIAWTWIQDAVTCVSDAKCIAPEHYVPSPEAEDLSLTVSESEKGTIPIWKLNVVDYWGTRPKNHAHNDYWWSSTGDDEWHMHPLGNEWIATPWPLPVNHTYLPYSIESSCAQLPVKSWDERNDTVLILAKKTEYFYHAYSPPAATWPRLLANDKFQLLSAAKEDSGYPLPDNLTTTGIMNKDKYNDLVGSVKVMLGIGMPTISPSVYVALCQGTPLVLPYFFKNPKTEGWDLYTGGWQHGPASMLGPPYVYSYWRSNATQMEEKIEQALANPIGRYIPDDMQVANVRKALSAYLDRDLYAMFQIKLRENGGRVPALEPFMMARCVELKRCNPLVPWVPISSTVEDGQMVPR